MSPIQRFAVILSTVAALALAASAIISLYAAPSTISLEGSMFISDAGRSHGGFEYTAGYNASLQIRGTTGKLQLTLEIGLGDALEKHTYDVSDFAMDATRISFLADGRRIVLVWVENDTIWEHEYDRHYIASWGGDAPPEEVRGEISPQVFPGLSSHYYVELRLRERVEARAVRLD